MGNKSSKSNLVERRSCEFEDEEEERSSGEHSVSGRTSQSYYTMLKKSYQALVNAIIRPPRCEYSMNQLGPKLFKFCGKTFQRTDFDLTNPRGLKFCCSMWEPVSKDRHNPVLPCVIYMHGNSSARVEALSCLSLVLGLGATLLSLDFCGSGKSEGDYVSLGAFERDDLQVVVEHLRDGGRTSTIALWGRSMGAATALLHAERDPSIAAMVLDSSFASLHQLAEEMVDRGRKQGLFAPGLLVKLAIRFIRSSVQKTAGFDIRQLAPIDTADKCFIPAMFIAGENDTFVPPHHSQMIHEKYGGDKNIVVVEGDHNSARPRFLYDSIGIFLLSTLQIPESWVLPDAQSYIRRCPWHAASPTDRYRQHGSRGHAFSEGTGDAETTGDEGGLTDFQDDEDLSMDELLALSMMQEEEEMTGVGVSESDLAMQRDVQARINDLLSGGISPDQIEQELDFQLARSEKRSAAYSGQVKKASSVSTSTSAVKDERDSQSDTSTRSGGNVNGAEETLTASLPSFPSQLSRNTSKRGKEDSFRDAFGGANIDIVNVPQYNPEETASAGASGSGGQVKGKGKPMSPAQRSLMMDSPPVALEAGDDGAGKGGGSSERGASNSSNHDQPLMGSGSGSNRNDSVHFHGTQLESLLEEESSASCFGSDSDAGTDGSGLSRGNSAEAGGESIDFGGSSVKGQLYEGALRELTASESVLPMHPDAVKNPSLGKHSTFHEMFDEREHQYQQEQEEQRVATDKASTRAALMVDSFIAQSDDTSAPPPPPLPPPPSVEPLSLEHSSRPAGLDKMMSLSEIPIVDCEYLETPVGMLRKHSTDMTGGDVGSPSRPCRNQGSEKTSPTPTLPMHPQNSRLGQRHSTFEKAFGDGGGSARISRGSPCVGIAEGSVDESISGSNASSSKRCHALGMLEAPSMADLPPGSPTTTVTSGTTATSCTTTATGTSGMAGIGSPILPVHPQMKTLGARHSTFEKAFGEIDPAVTSAAVSDCNGGGGGRCAIGTGVVYDSGTTSRAPSSSSASSSGEHEVGDQLQAQRACGLLDAASFVDAPVPLSTTTTTTTSTTALATAAGISLPEHPQSKTIGARHTTFDDVFGSGNAPAQQHQAHQPQQRSSEGGEAQDMLRAASGIEQP